MCLFVYHGNANTSRRRGGRRTTLIIWLQSCAPYSPSIPSSDHVRHCHDTSRIVLSRVLSLLSNLPFLDFSKLRSYRPFPLSSNSSIEFSFAPNFPIPFLAVSFVAILSSLRLFPLTPAPRFAVVVTRGTRCYFPPLIRAPSARA